MNKNENGMTLIEIMVALSVFTILVAIVFTSLSTFSKLFTSTDATNQLKSASQKIVNKIGLRLSESKRIFQKTAADTAFLARITLSDTVLLGSCLPKIEETGTVSPLDPAFTASSVGNSLLFTNTEYPAILKNVSASDGSNTYTVRLDTYVFNYYFLSPTTRYTIGAVPSIRLMEWHSKKYIDYNQLMTITDTTKRQSVIDKLVNAPNNIGYAWDPSDTDVANAFYSLETGSYTPTKQAAHFIQQDEYSEMTRFATGIAWGGYRTGVCPNTSISFSPGITVPLYGTSSGNFPAGFEIVVAGPRSAHRVFIRLVLAAQGPSNLLLAYENPILISARNLW